MNNNIPQGYKDSPLGIIPQEWEVKRLGEVGNISSGGTPLRDKKEYWNGDIPWITTSLINLPTIDFADEYITEIGLNESSAKMLKADTILMAMYGQGHTRGKVSILKIPAATNQACAAISPINQATKYIYYCLDAKYQTIRDLSNDGGQKNLSLGIIKNIQIPLPPLPEQQRIAEVLGTWDVAIEKQGALVDKLTERKRALMQQLLTAKKRLPNFSEPWETVRLGEVAKRVTRKNGENNQNVMTISAQKGFICQTDFFNKSIASETLSVYFLVQQNEFCYNKSYSNGYPMGATKRLKNCDKAVVTTLYICFSIIEEVCNLDFIEQYFESGALNKGLTKVANEGGRAHGLLNVTPTDFFNVAVQLPTLPEQTAIAQILTTADREIEGAKAKLESLRTQKRGLMQQLLSGKKRIKI